MSDERPGRVIWCDAGFWTAGFSPEARGRLTREAEAAGFRIVFADAAGPGEGVGAADVAFGQPDPDALRASPRLRWAHISSAGITRYDTPEVRDAFAVRGAMLSNSSHVYDEPCAQHALAMILAFARRLPDAWRDQADPAHPWNARALRSASFLLGPDQTVLLLGYGAIARRLAELLEPFGPRIIAVRREKRGDEGPSVTVIGEAALPSALPTADHVMNVLPEGPSTVGYVGAERLAAMKPGAFYYNIGRGATTDQDALLSALTSGRLAGAYLDVTTPEPLPPDHPLWTAPHCHITPHSAGGHTDEEARLVAHFLRNLRAFAEGRPLNGRVF